MRCYSRAGILLLPWATRWDVIVRGCSEDALIDGLQEAAPDRLVDVDECLQLARAVQSKIRWSSQRRPAFLSALSSLHHAAARQNAGQYAPSSQMEALCSLMDSEFAQVTIDFSDARTPDLLDDMVRARGDRMRAPLVAAFTESLRPTKKRHTPLSLRHAARFLLHLFSLDAPLNAASVRTSNQRPAQYPLPAALSGLPLSPDSASLPARWVDTACEMGAALCGELMSEDRLEQAPELHNLSKLPETATTLLLLFALFCAEPTLAAATSANVADTLVEAASRLCQYVSDSEQLQWSEVPAREEVRRCIEAELIKPLLPLLDLLTRHASRVDDDPTDTTQSKLLAAILPLPQSLLLWLQAQVAALPDNCWRYPEGVSDMFVQPSHGTSHPAAHVSDPCGCIPCQQLHLFLTSSTEHSTDLLLSKERRQHIEQRIASLRTPHLDYGPINTASSPYTLRVIKRSSLATVWKERRAAQQTSANRLGAFVASVADKLRSPPSTVSTSLYPQLSLSPERSADSSHSATSPTTLRSGDQRVTVQASHKRRRDAVELDAHELHQSTRPLSSSNPSRLAAFISPSPLHLATSSSSVGKKEVTPKSTHKRTRKVVEMGERDKIERQRRRVNEASTPTQR